jgi:peroxiredoxin
MLQPEEKRSRIASRSGTLFAGRFLLITLICVSAPLMAWGAQSLIDARAPDFALKNFAGENLRLSEFRGEIVLVNFWSTTCGRCREQLAFVDELFVEYGDQGFRVLGVSIDRDTGQVRKTAADLKLHFPVLFDDEHVVSKLYDLGSLPLTVLIDHHGNVRQVRKGYRAGDEEFYRDELEKLLAD